MMAALEKLNPELIGEEDMLNEMVTFAKGQSTPPPPAANETIAPPLKLIDPVQEEIERQRVAEITGFDDLESLTDLSDSDTLQ